MPKLTPPPRNKAEDKAISEAIRRDKKEQKETKKAAKAAARPKESFIGLLVAGAAVATGAYYGLNYLNRNDDVKPIAPPEEAQPLVPPPGMAHHKDKEKTKAPGAAAGKGAEDKSKPRLTAEAASGPAGLLAVTCNPECEIEVDGHPTGKHSPQPGLVIPSGTHKIRLVNAQLHLAVSDTVSIVADQTLARHYNLVMGSK